MEERGGERREEREREGAGMRGGEEIGKGEGGKVKGGG